MGQDLRYKIEHMGDSFVDLLEKIPAAAKESLGFLKKVPDVASESVEALKKIPDIAKDPVGLFKKVPDAARSSARGVILTYDIHEYGKKKEKLVEKIGSLLVELRKEGRETDAFEDETMKSLLSEADEIESKLSEFTIERTERLYPSEKSDNAPEDEENETAEETTVSSEEPETDTEESLNQQSVETVEEEASPEETVDEEDSSEDTEEEEKDPRIL